jgi:D-sedoheptulose 7-phosphate isomerase
VGFLDVIIMIYKDYTQYTLDCINQVDENVINEFVDHLKRIKKNNGRLFFLGVGGSAANCSHAVNDFRKIGGIDALTPLDNVSELTAYTNDVCFEDCFAESLKTSNLSEKDAICIFSVGGGSENTSKNIVKAIDFAKSVNAKILGIVSRDGGYTKLMGDCVIHFCPSSSTMITPIAESLQAVFWHYLVNRLN